MRKLRHDYVKNLIESEGYILHSEYRNAYDKLSVECPNGHLFLITWNSWKKGRRCKYCDSRIYYDDIYNAFISEGYKLLTSREEYRNSKQKLDYECPCGHIGTITWQHWRRGVRCKKCFFESRRYNFEKLKEDLQNENYVLLSKQEEYINEQSDLKIKCPNGHIYITTRSSWRAGSRCPICANIRKANRLRLKYDDVKENIEKEDYKLVSNNYENAFKKITVMCPHGHKYEVRWNDWQQGCRCSKCGRHSSKGETEIYEFLASLFPGIIRHDRTIISPYELDIVIPSKNIAIEYCGLYWHSELFVDKYYHLNKLEKCRTKGYKLITIFSDEWEFKRKIVEFKLTYLLNKASSKRVYARNCTVKVIDVDIKNKFLDKYHIQGRDISNVNLGLFHDDELLAVMTFSKGSIAKGSRPKDGIWELNRFASNYTYHIIGGASKLLHYFIDNYEWNEIFSYADRRWSDGKLYFKLGFTLDYATQPNYWYSRDGIHRLHRFNLRKRSYEVGTESALRLSEGYFRIWDCGNLKFILLKEDLNG